MEPSSHEEAVAQLRLRYEEGVRDGNFIPFTYPMATYGAAILILFFIIPSNWRFGSHFGRYFAFGLIAAWHFFLILKCRSYNASLGFGIGIVCAWGTLWSAVLLIIRDPKAEFKRIKRVEEKKEHFTIATQDAIRKKHEDSRAQRQILYRWQHYPEELLTERLWWTLDLLSNFRGFGWNWSIYGLPTRPLAVQLSLEGDSYNGMRLKDKKVSYTGIRRFDGCSEILLHNAWIFIKGYLGLDLLKVLIIKDPYFWGQVSAKAPNYLPHLIQRWSILLRAYRLFVTMSMIWLWLRTIFCLGPIILVGLLGPTRLGCSGEPWIYPDHYGHSLSNILNRGLAGWWGGWWHQTFRFAFQTSGDCVVRNLKVDSQSTLGQTIRLVAAFAFSGFLHASGSITMLGQTSPWSGTFLFFLLQSIGILIEMIWHKSLRRAGLLDTIPEWIGKATNFIFAHFWLYLTAPLLADDLARGGLLLMEPIIFSPLRGLGFGEPGDGFYCWQGSFIRGYTNAKWWLSGIAL